MRRLVPAAIAAAALACSPRPRSAAAPQPSPPVATAIDAGPTAPPLPPGVLAQREGSQGLIQVVERDGMRMLVVAGVVHAAVPTGGAGGPDPVVALARALRPGGKTALVIGLGSGKTASDLIAAGYQVDAIELEQPVIDFAVKYFGYRGRATAGDGRAFLDASQGQVWDLVLMDASSGDPPAPPSTLVDGRGLELLAGHTAAGGITILRMLGRPDQPDVDRMWHRLRDLGNHRFVQLFGSGVADEAQNLYLVAGDQGINFVNREGVAMWPLEPGAARPWAAPTLLAPGDPGAPSRKVRLLGYVVRLRENGALALDLPHWEMGAARYLLGGAAAQQLDGRLGPRDSFPTAGDISSDGDPAPTLHELLGGGGVKRSDVRFSPMIALIEGTATLVSVVNPDAAAAVPAGMRGDAPTDPLLPYGGALYRLEVDRVLWSLDRSGWTLMHKTLALPLGRLRAQLRAGDLRQGARAAADYLASLDHLGVPERLPVAAEMRALLGAMAPEIAAQPVRPTPFQRAAACDRLVHRTDDPAGLVSPDVVAADAALLACAIAGYEKTAANRKAADALTAAGRLLVLYDLTIDWNDPRSEKRAEASKRSLSRRYPDAAEIESPPTAPPPPAPGSP